MAAEPRLREMPIRVHALISELVCGGAETLLADLALVAAPVGIELSVGLLKPMARQPAADRLSELGIEPTPVPVGTFLSVSDHRRVQRHLAATRPDIVHTHLRGADVMGGVAGRRLGIPVVSTLHGFDWQESGARERARSALITQARKRLSRRLIAVSDALRHGYLAHSRDSDEHVVTIHSGIARAPRPGAGAGVRAELGIGREDLVAMMVSWMVPAKRHDVAIEAVGRLRDRLPSLRLVIVGEGPEEERLRRMARALGDAVVFTGHRADVMETLDAADVLVHPSYADAFPTTLLEAMAARVPIVATDVGGIPEIVEDGTTGILLDATATANGVATALATALQDAALRARLADEAQRRYAANFTALTWARRLRRLYDAELGG